MLIDVDKVSFMYIILILLSRNFRHLSSFQNVLQGSKIWSENIPPTYIPHALASLLLAASVVV